MEKKAKYVRGKTAPTWLSKGEEKKLFMTQSEVDAAREDGWRSKVDSPKEPGPKEPGLNAADTIAAIRLCESLQKVQLIVDSENARPEPRKTVISAFIEKIRELEEDE